MTVAGDPAAARRDIDGGAEAIIVVQRLPAAVVRVVVAGEIDTATAEMFRQTLAEAAAARPACVEIDLSAVTFFACAAVSVITALRAGGVTLVVVAARPPVRRLLALTGAAGVLAHDHEPPGFAADGSTWSGHAEGAP